LLFLFGGLEDFGIDVLGARRTWFCRRVDEEGLSPFPDRRRDRDVPVAPEELDHAAEEQGVVGRGFLLRQRHDQYVHAVLEIAVVVDDETIQLAAHGAWSDITLVVHVDGHPLAGDRLQQDVGGLIRLDVGQQFGTDQRDPRPVLDEVFHRLGKIDLVAPSRRHLSQLLLRHARAGGVLACIETAVRPAIAIYIDDRSGIRSVILPLQHLDRFEHRDPIPVLPGYRRDIASPVAFPQDGDGRQHRRRSSIRHDLLQ